MSRAAGVVGDQAIRAGVEYSRISVATLTAIVLSSVFVFVCGVIAIYLYMQYEDQKMKKQYEEQQRRKNAGEKEGLL
jgi:hypothetical protein